MFARCSYCCGNTGAAVHRFIFCCLVFRLLTHAFESYSSTHRTSEDSLTVKRSRQTFAKRIYETYPAVAQASLRKVDEEALRGVLRWHVESGTD